LTANMWPMITEVVASTLMLVIANA